MSNVVFFDGVDDYVDCGNNASLHLTTAFTFDVLVKIRKIKDATYPEFLAKWVGSQGYSFFIDNTGKVWITINATSLNTTAIYQVKDDNRWYRVSASWVGGAGIKFYVNGNLIFTSAIVAGPIIDSATNIHIGDNTAGGNFWQGNMAEVLIYNRQLTDDEILYNSSHPSKPKRRGLVLNLNQDSIYGPQWVDLSGNANHGTYVGGAVPVTANRLAGR